ncbi:ECF transporter S component [Athalassotoga saccharophila]|uniref:ECF transporter S component n=1 Tax=Athalassotoga saccharophila TaxID=1441386 RepID=UPI001379F831|nr:ECF transporter S component [Athalassotoga saccharophila]BBJ27989.1 hypothetical protein ATHSA_0889 [Athalassotoga saccharophila]
MNKTKKITLIAIFIALSFVGSLIKIPSPIGDVGFDSTAGFTAALYLGYIPGAIVTSLGYLVITMSAGFPLGILTLPVALEMFFVAIAYRFFFKINKIIGIAIATALNGIISPLIVLPVGGYGLYLALIPSLTLASLLNLVLSAIIFEILSRRKISS